MVPDDIKDSEFSEPIREAYVAMYGVRIENGLWRAVRFVVPLYPVSCFYGHPIEGLTSSRCSQTL